MLTTLFFLQQILIISNLFVAFNSSDHIITSSSFILHKIYSWFDFTFHSQQLMMANCLCILLIFGKLTEACVCVIIDHFVKIMNNSIDFSGVCWTSTFIQTIQDDYKKMGQWIIFDPHITLLLLLCCGILTLIYSLDRANIFNRIFCVLIDQLGNVDPVFLFKLN